MFCILEFNYNFVDKCMDLKDLLQLDNFHLYMGLPAQSLAR